MEQDGSNKNIFKNPKFDIFKNHNFVKNKFFI